MKYLRRTIWYVASRLLIVSLVLGVLVTAFYYAMNLTNVYIVLKDGMARRAQVVIDTSGSIGYTKAMIPPLYAQELGLSDAPDEGGPHGESPDAHPAPPAR